MIHTKEAPAHDRKHLTLARWSGTPAPDALNAAEHSAHYGVPVPIDASVLDFCRAF